MTKQIDAMKTSMAIKTEVQQKGRKQRPKKEERVKTTIYLPLSLWIEIGDVSRRNRTSANDVIIRAVENLLQKTHEDNLGPS